MEIAAVAAGSLVGLVGSLCIVALARFLYLRCVRLRALEEEGSSHNLPAALRHSHNNTETVQSRESHPPPSPSMARSGSMSSDEGGDAVLPESTVRRLSTNLTSPRSPKTTVLAFLSESKRALRVGKKEPQAADNKEKAVEPDIDVLTLE
jgi:hypothetical protein